MITMLSKEDCEISFHQSDVDNYQVEIIDSAGNRLAGNVTEKQINNLAEVIARHNDLKL